MPELLIFIVGFACGGFIVFIFYRNDASKATALAEGHYKKALQEQQEQAGKMAQSMRDAFEALSHRALSQNTEDFLKLAELVLSKKLAAGEQSLTGKKALIDQTLKRMHTEMGQLQQALQVFEQERANKYGQLAQQLRHTAEQTARLHASTEQLKSVLDNTKARGQWGERMAEDILRTLGMQEGINYQKQQTGSQAQRPDFTFLLPKGRCVNMDVKFPLNNYLRFAEANSDQERQAHLNAFLRDVRQRIKEVGTRQYIDPAAHTLDYVLVFIPNESVYRFIMEQDGQLLDDALQRQVVLCSPITLYAILSVMRQASEHFSMEAQASALREQLLQFKSQWEKYVQSMDRLGRRIDDVQKEFQQLTQTRTRQLDKALQRIEGKESDNLSTTGKLFDD